MFDTHGGWGFGMGFGMWLFWIVLIVILVAVVRLISHGSGSSSGKADKSPMDILKERYARGEIDEEKFNRQRHELEK